MPTLANSAPLRSFDILAPYKLAYYYYYYYYYYQAVMKTVYPRVQHHRLNLSNAPLVDNTMLCTYSGTRLKSVHVHALSSVYPISFSSQITLPVPSSVYSGG